MTLLSPWQPCGLVCVCVYEGKRGWGGVEARAGKNGWRRREKVKLVYSSAPWLRFTICPAAPPCYYARIVQSAMRLTLEMNDYLCFLIQNHSFFLPENVLCVKASKGRRLFRRDCGRQLYLPTVGSVAFFYAAVWLACVSSAGLGHVGVLVSDVV